LCRKIAYAQVLSIGARRMMKRREFITLIGGAAAAFPDVVYGQQPVAVIGLLGSSASDDYRPMIAAFQKGLSEAGYVEGRNVSFDHAWAIIITTGSPLSRLNSRDAGSTSFWRHRRLLL